MIELFGKGTPAAMTSSFLPKQFALKTFIV
jgi:hypothetical protein